MRQHVYAFPLFLKIAYNCLQAIAEFHGRIQCKIQDGFGKTLSCGCFQAIFTTMSNRFVGCFVSTDRFA